MYGTRRCTLRRDLAEKWVFWMLALRTLWLTPFKARHSSSPVVSRITGAFQGLGAVSCVLVQTLFYCQNKPVVPQLSGPSGSGIFPAVTWILCLLFSSVVAEKWPMRITEALRRKHLSWVTHLAPPTRTSPAPPNLCDWYRTCQVLTLLLGRPSMEFCRALVAGERRWSEATEGG